MPNTYVRMNLASAVFPFYTESAGRTVMIPEQDENWDRYNAASTVTDKGVPQVFYMHNVVPIAGGFQSVGYLPQLVGMVGHTDFDNCLPLLSGDLSTFLFVPAGGLNYIYDGDVAAWASVSPFSNGTVPGNVLVTTAYVQGTTYIYYANLGCFVYNSSTKLLVPTTLTGLTPSLVLGICEANGYMIAWTTSGVFWSSVSQPTNFVPSIQTGAGGGNVQDAKGPINFCVGISGGFLIYCQKNVVGATYTANTNFPYIITEVTGSGGVGSIDFVGHQGNLPYQVAMTTAGIQQISLNSAIPTMPEVSDFLTAQVFEDFDEVAVSLTTSFIPNQLAIKISAVSEKYIVISYGVQAPNFTHAIVYDIGLNRYGKLKLAHRSCFPYLNPAPYGLITYDELMHTVINTFGDTTYQNLFTTMQLAIVPKQNLAFLQQDGTVQLVDFEVSEANADGVFIIGKFQLKRGNMFVHQRTDVETATTVNTLALWLLPSFDGKSFSPAVATITNLTSPFSRTFAKRSTAMNMSLCLIGAFNLTSIIMNFTIGGSR